MSILCESLSRQRQNRHTRILLLFEREEEPGYIREVAESEERDMASSCVIF